MFQSTMKVRVLNRKHAEFQENEHELRLIELLTCGGADLRKNLDLVLVDRPMEPSEMKGYRKSLFNYNNILGTVNGWYVAKLFEETPSVDMKEETANEELRDFLQDCDRVGTKFVDKMRVAASTLLKFRRVYALVDQPRPTKSYATRAEERQEKATTPYVVFYDPRHVINWGRDEYGALKWMIARTVSTSTAEEFPHDPQQNMNWWYFSRQGTAHYVAAMKDGKLDEQQDAMLVYSAEPDGKNIFPVVEIELPEEHWLSYRALLPAIKLLNLENALDWQLFINALAVLVIKGKVDEKPALSELAYIQLDQDGDASYLEQSGNMAAILRERCQELLENCYRLMYVVQQGRSGSATAAAQSGISKEQDTMPSLHVCSSIGDNLRIGMTRILGIVSELISSQAPEVRGFSFPTDDVNGSLATLETLNSLEIPSDTLYQEMEVAASKEVLGDQPQSILQAVENEIRAGSTRSQRIEQKKKDELDRFSSSFGEAA